MAPDPQPNENSENRYTIAAAKVLNTPELLAGILVKLDTPELMVCMLVNKSMHNAITKTSKLRARTESLHIQQGRCFEMPGFSYYRETYQRKVQHEPVVEYDRIDMALEVDGTSFYNFPILGSRWREMLIHQDQACEFYVHPPGGTSDMMRAEVYKFEKLWQEVRQTCAHKHRWLPESAGSLGVWDHWTQTWNPLSRLCVRIEVLSPWRSAGVGSVF